jgi:hypothetical protein
MRINDWLLTISLLLTPAVAVDAQDARDDIRVLRSAVVFVRDSLARTKKVYIDRSLYRRGPAISDTAAGQVAREVGASKGRLDDLLLCGGKPQGPWCRIKDDAVVISLSQPRIRGDEASVVAYFTYFSGGRELVASSHGLGLTRLANGSWRVREAKLLMTS